MAACVSIQEKGPNWPLLHSFCVMAKKPETDEIKGNFFLNSTYLNSRLSLYKISSLVEVQKLVGNLVLINSGRQQSRRTISVFQRQLMIYQYHSDGSADAFE